ncbi:hypothetical protein Vafri_5316 [Volvox africanus]|uniref:Uncharacterized protein n=1 Tax=Volvox africanus TaxID=51714 RepID=A0A8J4AY87_9CHLO|nr:hypothetical protein Vafri_5316 [Volvox africanus]
MWDHRTRIQSYTVVYLHRLMQLLGGWGTHPNLNRLSLLSLVFVCWSNLALSVQHTSASLTINENADPDVRKDMETYLNLSVPEGPTAPWVHTDEGPDDMPAHVKSSLLGASLTIPISHGRLALGTWQVRQGGIFLTRASGSASTEIGHPAAISS